MALTLKWWTDLKALPDNKVNGKTAPETEFERKLTAYDKARQNYSDGPQALLKASKAVDEVEKARSDSSKALSTQGFAKLAEKCSPNARVLATLISDEKRLLAAAKPQIDAMSKIGGPVLNLSSGPGGNTIRQGKFNQLKSKIKELDDDLRKTPQLKKEDIDKCLIHMAPLEKDVKLYCGDRPALKAFNDDYVGTVAGFKTVKSKWGDKKKVVTELQTIGTRLTRLVSAQYVA